MEECKSKFLSLCFCIDLFILTQQKCFFQCSNVAETLVSKGLATVLRYRQDDDQRSSHYDQLLAAETKASKSGHGLHSKKEPPVHRVVDVSGDLAKAKLFLPFLQRAGRTEAIAEFITSRSRLRLYLPKDSRLITLLLAGITYNKSKQGQSPYNDGEPFTDEEATNFTRERCMQREVQITVESMDRVGNYIGWLWVENVNLSVALVEEGYAKVHSSAEWSDHHRALKTAEESAKARRIGVCSSKNFCDFLTFERTFLTQVLTLFNAVSGVEEFQRRG